MFVWDFRSWLLSSGHREGGCYGNFRCFCVSRGMRWVTMVRRENWKRGKALWGNFVEIFVVGVLCGDAWFLSVPLVCLFVGVL